MFKQFIVLDKVYDGDPNQRGLVPEYVYKYSHENLYKIEEYRRMSNFRKIGHMKTHGWCEGAEGTLVIDSEHPSLTGLYKETLQNLKYQIRDQRLEELLNNS